MKNLLVLLCFAPLSLFATLEDGYYWFPTGWHHKHLQQPDGSGELVFVSYLGDVGKPYLADTREGQTTVLLDGRTSWDEVAQTAAAQWNPYLRGFQVKVEVGNPDSVPAIGNGINEIFWQPDPFSHPHGDWIIENGRVVEWDIALGRKFTTTNKEPIFWNSYRNHMVTVSQVFRPSLEPIFDMERLIAKFIGFALGLAPQPIAPFPPELRPNRDYGTALMDGNGVGITPDRVTIHDAIGIQEIYGYTNAALPTFVTHLLPDPYQPDPNTLSNPSQVILIQADRVTKENREIARHLTKAIFASNEKKLDQSLRKAIRAARNQPAARAQIQKILKSNPDDVTKPMARKIRNIIKKLN